MVGICAMCKKPNSKLTTHHVWEAPLKDGAVQNLDICDDCHVNHHIYTNALRDNGIEIDRRKLDV